jgi:hypothetical protein
MQIPPGTCQHRILDQESGEFMAEREFRLSTREETVCFERLLDEYRQRHGLHPYCHLPLGPAHEVLVEHPEGGRLFVSLFDIQLGRVFLDEDLNVITDVLNRDIHERRSSNQSIPAGLDFFAERVDLHKACTNFVLRYRALWDKIMGVLILLLCSKEYDKFGRARSRMQAFAKIMCETNSLPEEECKKMEKYVTDFNNRFRTAEAHGAGILRKWSLVVQDDMDNPIEDLLWASNKLDERIALISCIIMRFRSRRQASSLQKE